VGGLFEGEVALEAEGAEASGEAVLGEEHEAEEGGGVIGGVVFGELGAVFMGGVMEEKGRVEVAKEVAEGVAQGRRA
jgi:hypothetical protein